VRVPFELEPVESVGAGVRRIVDEQLASALAELRDANPADADETVHAARKRFKRIRAVVRLIREELGDETFASENASFRDAGASLAEARDAAVLVQTLDGLKDRIDRPAFAAARKRLVARRKLVSQRVLGNGNGLESVALAAEQARDRVAGWRIDRDGWRAIRPGLKRIYSNGREAYKRAEIDAPADLFHEWRKQVKNLWHQLEILEPIWPAVMKKLADECHALADALGRDHDLAVLRAVLEAETLTSAGEPSPVLPPLDADRRELQREALALGARIYAEKPNPFVRRLAKYWKAWHAQHATGAADEMAVAGEETPAAVVLDESQGTQDAGGGSAEPVSAATAAQAVTTGVTTGTSSDNGNA
jgi:CHAD domain-containing protein